MFRAPGSSRTSTPKPGMRVTVTVRSLSDVSWSRKTDRESKSVQNISSYFRDGTGHSFVCFVCIVFFCVFFCLVLALCITFFQTLCFVFFVAYLKYISHWVGDAVRLLRCFNKWHIYTAYYVHICVQVFVCFLFFYCLCVFSFVSLFVFFYNVYIRR